MTSPRPRALVRSAAAAAGLALGLALTGCSATNPIQTQAEYSASDGVRATVGDVRATNLLLVTQAQDSPGVLLGAFTNDGDQDTTLTVAFLPADAAAGDEPENPTTIALPAGGTVLLQGADAQDGSEVTVPQTPAAPGDVATVVLSTDVGGSQTLTVPVLDGRLPDYADLVPTEG